MALYKVIVTYPNAQVEELDQEFYVLSQAIEGAKHILGQVEHNAQYHEDQADGLGGLKRIKPYCVVKEIKDDKGIIVFDTRK